MADDKYLFYDGANYISPCDCNISIYTPGSTTPQIIDPNNCIIKYYDGANWCNLVCPCECPAGYEFSYITNNCIQYESAVYTGTTALIEEGHQDRLFTGKGLRLFADIGAATLPLVGDGAAYPAYAVVDNNGAGATIPPTFASIVSRLWGVDAGTCTQSEFQGRLNLTTIWPNGWPASTDICYEYCITLVAPKQYLFGMSGDEMSISIDSGAGFVEQVKLINSTGSTDYWKNWWVFPITLPAGTHVIKFCGQDLYGTLGALGFEIYDMGDISVGPNAPYAAPYDKFVDFLTEPAGTSPACGNEVADILPFIEFSTANLVGFNVAAFGSGGTWSCPDSSPVDECHGTPQCLDEIPCTGNTEPPLISNNTEINIWFDNSGSMDTTLSGLEEMQDDYLKDCLLPIYNNDLALYEERVKVFNMYDSVGGWSFNERFVRCLGEGKNFERTVDANVDQVINLTFQDESNAYGYGNPTDVFDGAVREPWYDVDILYTRNQQATAVEDIRGTHFRVATTLPNNPAQLFPAFRNLSQATFVNNGVYVSPFNLSDYYTTKYNVNLDTLPGQGGEYYRNLVVAALNALGLNIPVCP